MKILNSKKIYIKPIEYILKNDDKHNFEMEPRHTAGLNWNLYKFGSSIFSSKNIKGREGIINDTFIDLLRFFKRPFVVTVFDQIDCRFFTEEL